MNYRILATAALLGMTSIPAFAQIPPPGPPATGARPGEVPDIVEQRQTPHSSGMMQQSNAPSTTMQAPSASLGNSADTRNHLQAARSALASGRTSQAQEALEMAETRVLNRSMLEGRTEAMPEPQIVADLRDARMALRGGDRQRAIGLVDNILARTGG